jgi:DnaJ-class molecular chaperone
LLAAYIKKRFGKEYSKKQSQEDLGQTRHSSAITRTDALSILGLEDPVSKDEVNAAYKKLISKVHPDAGGNAFLAARVNEARDILLKGR